MADLCYGCMKDTSGEQVCPHCGFAQDTVQASPYLPLGTILEKDRYTVGRVLDSRSDSARYIGYDNKKEKIVAIREFLPKDLFTRSENSLVVTVSKGRGKRFNSLKQSFMDIGKKIKALDGDDNIVAVENVFEDNNTAYVVTEYEEVISFEEYVERSGGRLEWEAVRPLIKPLISSLTRLSDSGINHLAICPENLVVTPDGKIKLDNFSIVDICQNGKALPAQLTAGCSAPEQYEADGVLDAKTDIYGFCATLFFALTGKLPLDAVKRKEDSRLLMSASVAKKLPPFVITTLAKGLQVDREQRIADFKTLDEQLSAAPTVQAMQNEISKTIEVDAPQDKPKRRLGNFQLGVISMVVALLIFGCIGYLWYSQYPLDGLFNVNTGATENASNPSEKLSEDFTYAADSEYFRVPDFTGKTWAEAKAIADDSSEYYIFKAVDEEFSDTIPEGKICKQTPGAKKTVNRGNDGVSITCTISKGAQYRKLPKVENINKDKAADSLVKEGFVVNSTLAYNDRVEAGTVISYSGNAKEGDKLEYGSTVTINVSLGKKPEAPTDAVFAYDDKSQMLTTRTTPTSTPTDATT